jgi:predicted transposase YdaD
MTISTAHDHFFRKSFGRVEIARNYLEEYLPAEVMALLDLDTLWLEEDTFIDEEMQKHQADLALPNKQQATGNGKQLTVDC